MIPKIIHYCWFGGKPMSRLGEKCLASWKKYCPDYEIVRWDESSYDVSKNVYMKQAYDAGKWGFVPDYARLDIIYRCGGIYLDTDVELVRPLDDLLGFRCFVGIEENDKVALGLGFGAEKGNGLLSDMMKEYEDRSFLRPDGTPDLTPSPVIQSAFFSKNGFTGCADTPVEFRGCTVFPKRFFNPTDMNSGRIDVTPDTFSIHHYAASWETPVNRFRGKVYQTLYRSFGEGFAEGARRVFGKRTGKKK